MIENIQIPKAGWTACHLALILLISWMLAGLINSYLISQALHLPMVEQKSAPMDHHSPHLLAPPSDYTDILRKNIFNSASVQNSSASISSPSLDSIDGAPKTSLNLKLMGTMLWGSLKIAVIQLSPGSEQAFKLRDSAGGAEIVEIERNRVTLLNNGRLESLELEFEEGVSAPGIARPLHSMSGDVSKTGDGAIISKGYLEGQLKSMNQLLTQVRAVPNMDEKGATNGFKLFAIQSGSIFEKIGLSNEDVVQKINGIELNSAEKGLELFQALRNETNFNVDIIRGTQKTTLRFAVQ